MIITIHSSIGDFDLDIPPYKIWELINLHAPLKYLSFKEFTDRWCNLKDKESAVPK
jgi:hypothetical protein